MKDQFAQQEPGAAAQRVDDPGYLPSQEAAMPPPNPSEPEGLSHEEADRHARIAEFNSHPHTQLTGILKDLQAPTAIDPTARLAATQGALRRLIGLLLRDVRPPRHPDEPNPVDTDLAEGVPHEGQ